MRTRVLGMCLALFALPLTAVPCNQPAEQSDEVKVAKNAEAKDCPTEIEVQPYIWIEPNTGAEYTVLHLHCPGEDEA